MNDELLTVREVALACGRSEETVRRWIWSGKLPATKLGNQLFLKRVDVEAMRAPKVREAKVAYGGQRRSHIEPRATRMKYDREVELRRLDEMVAFGEKLYKEWGHYDVSEGLRRVREDYD